MARLTRENVERARQTIALYPYSRSALIPLLHIAQEQDGWVTEDAMTHIAELLEITPAEVLGTASFYEMFQREPVGKYLVNVCTNVSCMVLGGYELLEHLEQRLGTRRGTTTVDGMFTLQEVECIAACTDAPCLLVNYRLFKKLSNADADRLVDDLRSGKLADTVPPHGVTNRVRRAEAAQKAKGAGAEPAAVGAEPVSDQTAVAPGPVEETRTHGDKR